MELLTQILGGLIRLAISVLSFRWLYRREIDQNRFAGRDLRANRATRRFRASATWPSRTVTAARRRDMFR